MKWYEYIGAVKRLTIANQDLFKRLAEAEVTLDKRNKQFRVLQNVIADTVDIPLSALSQELAKIKQELGILKATENRAEALVALVSSYHRVTTHIALQQRIPYQELERLQEALEQLATANQELQQWSGEGEERHVKP